jgi:uncharacterized protein
LEDIHRFVKLWLVDENQIVSKQGPGFKIEPSALGHHATPDNPPWGPLIAVLVWIASVIAIVLFPLLFLMPYAVSSGPSFSEQQAFGEFLKQDPTAMILQIAGIIPAHIATLVLAWIVTTKLNKFSFTETLGWRSGGMAWWHYLAILVFFFAVASVVGIYLPEQENELTRILQSSRSAVFLVAFMATFTAPIVEEVIYRGILYSAFQRTLGAVLAIIAVTLLFALVHVPQYYPSISTIALLLLLSLILTLVRAWTGNLLPCIILHTIFNGTQSLLLILEPYIKASAPTVEPAASVFLK